MTTKEIKKHLQAKWPECRWHVRKHARGVKVWADATMTQTEAYTISRESEAFMTSLGLEKNVNY